MSARPYLRLVIDGRAADKPGLRYTIPDAESDLHEAAKRWLTDQLLDGKSEDFIVDREDFGELATWSMIKWKRGKPYLDEPYDDGRPGGVRQHRIRIPGTRFA